MIVININENQISVERVKNGGVFEYENEYFIATNNFTEIFRFCVHLETGDLIKMIKGTFVNLKQGAKISI